MDIGWKSARIGLLVAVATLVSGGAAQLSGPSAACAFADPLRLTVQGTRPEAGAPKREVKTIGMMLAEQDPPV